MVTAVTAQSPRGVISIHPVPIAEIANQLQAVLENFPLRAVKTGMLGRAELIDLILDRLPEDLPLVVDPVLRATSGAEFANEELIAAYPRLFARATLATPNLDEAAVFDDWPCPVLIKGGHAQAERGTDRLIIGVNSHVLRSPQLEMGEVHGTGCLLSAAIAAHLAQGEELLDAVRHAKEWFHRALERRFLAGEYPVPGEI